MWCVRWLPTEYWVGIVVVLFCCCYPNSGHQFVDQTKPTASFISNSSLILLRIGFEFYYHLITLYAIHLNNIYIHNSMEFDIQISSTETIYNSIYTTQQYIDNFILFLLLFSSSIHNMSIDIKIWPLHIR